MDTILFQSVGIDIAKDKFDACFKEKGTNKAIIKGTKTFGNDAKGFVEFLDWCRKRKKENASICFVMEATGVYYENLCYFLHFKKERVCVELPQKVKYYAKSLNVKTKTDKVDANLIAEIGLERHTSLKSWAPPSKGFKEIRDLTRELARLKKYKTAASSQIHALETAHGTSKDALRIAKKQWKQTDKLIKELEAVLLKTVKKDKHLYEKIERISEVKGLGILSIVKVIAETNGFLLFGSIRQLVSYAGLDVVQDQSGTHNGRPKISKKGNAHLRQALYMPAVSAATHNEKMKSFYDRLNEKFVYKKQSLVAVMRKLLVTIYTLWKKGEEYDPNHQWQGGKRKREVALPLEDSHQKQQLLLEV